LIEKYLKEGILRNDPNNSALLITPYNQEEPIIILNHSSLTPQMWGQAYEKHIGQYYESLGYNVEYNGLNKGCNDGGIDLVAVDKRHTMYIQCKYIRKNPFTKSRIETLLYNSGNTLAKLQTTKTDIFALVVPNIDVAFRKQKIVGVKERYKYPLIDYFLSKNNVQNRILLEIIEIPF